jgi:hypothetical protein
MPDPAQTPKEVARETARGRSDRTPWLALGAVQLTIAAAVAIVVLVAGLAYALS